MTVRTDVRGSPIGAGCRNPTNLAMWPQPTFPKNLTRSRRR